MPTRIGIAIGIVLFALVAGFVIDWKRVNGDEEAWTFTYALPVCTIILLVVKNC